MSQIENVASETSSNGNVQLELGQDNTNAMTLVDPRSPAQVAASLPTTQGAQMLALAVGAPTPDTWVCERKNSKSAPVHHDDNRVAHGEFQCKCFRCHRYFKRSDGLTVGRDRFKCHPCNRLDGRIYTIKATHTTVNSESK